MLFTYPSDPLVSPDVIANYTLNINSLGNVPNTLSLTAYGPQGFAIQFSPNSINLNVTQPSTVVEVTVSPQVNPGAYNLVVSATGSGETYNETVEVQVVKYLVFAIDTKFFPAT